MDETDESFLELSEISDVDSSEEENYENFDFQPELLKFPRYPKTVLHQLAGDDKAAKRTVDLSMPRKTEDSAEYSAPSGAHSTTGHSGLTGKMSHEEVKYTIAVIF